MTAGKLFSQAASLIISERHVFHFRIVPTHNRGNGSSFPGVFSKATYQQITSIIGDGHRFLGARIVLSFDRNGKMADVAFYFFPRYICGFRTIVIAQCTKMLN